MTPVVQPIDEELRELGANPGIPLREPVRELEHRRPNDVLRSRPALGDEVSADELPVEAPLALVDRELLPHPDTRREAVDLLAGLERVFDDRTGRTHLLERLRRELDFFSATSDANDLVEREVVPREEDGHPQTTRAVSAIVAQLRPLVLDRQGVPEHRGREAALRREREPLERAERARLLDSRGELVHRLAPAALRRHEAEHGGLPLRHGTRAARTIPSARRRTRA